MIVREERAGDEAAIYELTARAFAGMRYSDGSEPAIIDRLRLAGALAVSLVAEEAGSIIGHVGFSPVALSGGDLGWYGLGPVSVEPSRQKGGIGSRLIREGIDRLRRMDAAGCVLVGAPGYYRRFGFDHVEGLSADGEPAEYFMALALKGAIPSGIVAFHPGFYGGAA